jgi:hypothetical protein
VTRVTRLLDDQFHLNGNQLHMGQFALYSMAQTAARVRANAEKALQSALASGDNAIAMTEAPDDPSDNESWQPLLDNALQTHGFFLQGLSGTACGRPPSA